MNAMSAFGMGLLATFAFSTAAADCNTWSCGSIRITGLYTTANGDVYVQVSGNMAALNCTLASDTYITLPSTLARFKEIYASLLAYQLTDRELSIRIVEGSPGCNVQYIYAAS